MKNPKKPTLAQKKFLQENGMDPQKWLVIKDTSRELEVISRIALQKNTGKTKVFRKG